ncbi:hypothetical protein Swit_1925 [Rhizorhabdus wittichii RW1]|uniref:Uncharacterized protein n=1 Tax=Rhizorhabdus wittichii (strain DSM 6014 / CCUG 31198 / JCM 15750 / NBRC 105917 / EY 4224 / RW1) TaxID=392499 RepID=A0A9J9LDU6_RHIWR|nr:hypothetical protein Swit_1925 [Rhizorhabdus wittichii RW1]
MHGAFGGAKRSRAEFLQGRLVLLSVGSHRGKGAVCQGRSAIGPDRPSRRIFPGAPLCFLACFLHRFFLKHLLPDGIVSGLGLGLVGQRLSPWFL